MSSTLKARILGFLVLASLAIIFLPWIFDGTGVKEREAMDMSIPPAPEMPEVVVHAPNRDQLDKPLTAPAPIPETVNETKADAAKKVAKETTKSASKPSQKPERALSLEEKPKLDTEGVPVAWTLQLASFKDKTNAEKLRARLVKKGYKSYIRQRDGLSKVFVGPDIQRTQIEKLRSQLKKEFKLDGLILRFTTNAS